MSQPVLDDIPNKEITGFAGGKFSDHMPVMTATSVVVSWKRC